MYPCMILRGMTVCIFSNLIFICYQIHCIWQFTEGNLLKAQSISTDMKQEHFLGKKMIVTHFLNTRVKRFRHDSLVILRETVPK